MHHYYVIKCTCNKWGVKETKNQLMTDQKKSYTCKYCGKTQKIFKSKKPSLTVIGGWQDARLARDKLISITNQKIISHEELITTTKKSEDELRKWI